MLAYVKDLTLTIGDDIVHLYNVNETGFNWAHHCRSCMHRRLWLGVSMVTIGYTSSRPAKCTSGWFRVCLIWQRCNLLHVIIHCQPIRVHTTSEGAITEGKVPRRQEPSRPSRSCKGPETSVSRMGHNRFHNMKHMHDACRQANNTSQGFILNTTYDER